MAYKLMMEDSPSDLKLQLKSCQDNLSVLTFEVAQLKFQKIELEKELEPHRAREGSGGKIHSNDKQLQQAFALHRANSNLCKPPNASQYLLLFYAAECGLKAVFLRRNSLGSTQQIADKSLLSQDGHNLSRWIKELRLPAGFTLSNSNFRLRSGDETQSLDKAHQVWRYGIRIQANDEQRIVLWLETICNWLSEETR